MREAVGPRSAGGSSTCPARDKATAPLSSRRPAACAQQPSLNEPRVNDPPASGELDRTCICFLLQLVHTEEPFIIRDCFLFRRPLDGRQETEPSRLCPPNRENYEKAMFPALAGIDTKTQRACNLINTEPQGQFL